MRSSPPSLTSEFAELAAPICIRAQVSIQVAVAGVLLGIIALALGAGPSTVANTIYHRVILGVLVVVLVGLSTPAARTALGHRIWV